MQFKEKLKYILLITIILGAGLYHFYISDIQRNINIKQEELVVIKEDINRRSKLLVNPELQKKMYNKKIKQLKAQQEEALFINNRDKLFMDIINLASNTNINIKTIEYKESKPLGDYEVYPLHLNVRGDYYSMKKFIDKINKFKYLIRVENLSVATIKENNIEVAAKILNFVREEEDNNGNQTDN